MRTNTKLMSDIEGLAKAAPDLSRRGFFMTASAAAAAGYTLAAGPVRADVIHTDASGLVAGDAKIKVSDGEMPGYYAKPANAPNPPVILVAMEIFEGGDTSRLGIIGFCRGGRTVWQYAAHDPGLKAAVAFYGPVADPSSAAMPRNAISLAPEMKAPVLGLYGEADSGIPVAQVEQMKAALEANKKTAEFKIYKDAPHGFHADYRASYRKEAAEDAWNQLQGWFKKHKVLD